jgi:hypothetical protein
MNMNLYKGNYTCLLFSIPSDNLLRTLIKTEPGFMNKYFKYFNSKEVHYKYISFNQNQFKKELKEYLYQLSENPILKQSFSSLDISNNDFVANDWTSSKLDDWDLKLYVSNDILIQVYEKYFILIAGPRGGNYTWAYFKQPLTLNFIKNKVLVEENCRCQHCQEQLCAEEQRLNFETCQHEVINYRSIMCNSEFSTEINQHLWDDLYKNALGLYANYTDFSTKTASKSDSYPNIDNSMRFIQKFKDELDWVVVQYLYPIYFTDEFLSKYRNYLIFHHYVTELHEGKVVYNVHGCVSDKMEITNGGIMSRANIASRFFNRKGKEFMGGNNSNAIIDSSDKITISESDNVIWSSELLIKLKDYLSWHLLSNNEALPWSLELLIAFRDKWDFKALSSNRAIRWTHEIVKEFREEVSANLLSSNTNVDWNQLPSGFFYEGRLTLTDERGSWDWNEISNNAGINEEFIQKHQSHIVFADGRKGCNWDFKTVKYLSIMNPKLSLSSNPGLIWTDSLIQTYIKKLDFWVIALRGKIDSNLVMKYAAFFNESREYSTHRQKNSDYPSIKVHNFSSGWQNLKKNIDFHPTEEFFYFAKKYSTRIYKPYYDDTGPDHKIQGYVDPQVSSNFEEVSVYSIFK